MLLLQSQAPLACGITLGMALADDFARIRLATSLVYACLGHSTFPLPRSVSQS